MFNDVGIDQIRILNMKTLMTAAIFFVNLDFEELVVGNCYFTKSVDHMTR